MELSSGKEVADIIPNLHEIKKCSGGGIIVTGPAPAGSGYDFFTRFFCPKLGIDEVMSYSMSRTDIDEDQISCLLTIACKKPHVSIVL